MSDKYGCDRCFNTDADLCCCEDCNGLFCVNCIDRHEREDHKYPINRWKGRTAQSTAQAEKENEN